MIRTIIAEDDAMVASINKTYAEKNADIKVDQIFTSGTNAWEYLQKNSAFTLNVYNSDSRLYMVQYLEGKMEMCIRSFTEIVAEGRNISQQDFEFVVKFYAKCAIGFISQWLDMGMQLPKEITTDRILCTMQHSIENILDRFRIDV